MTRNYSLGNLKKNMFKVRTPKKGTMAEAEPVKEEEPPTNTDELTLQEHQELWCKLREVVSCPVCCDCLKVPVTHCHNGHTVCNNCHARVRHCPICRGNFIPLKIRVLENVLDSLPHKHESCGETKADVLVKAEDVNAKCCGFQISTGGLIFIFVFLPFILWFSVFKYVMNTR